MIETKVDVESATTTAHPDTVKTPPVVDVPVESLQTEPLFTGKELAASIRHAENTGYYRGYHAAIQTVLYTVTMSLIVFAVVKKYESK